MARNSVVSAVSWFVIRSIPPASTTSARPDRMADTAARTATPAEAHASS
jgi:hypothetical protein